MHAPDRTRKTCLRSSADSTKKYITKIGRVVFKLLQQTYGEQKGKGIFESSVNPYLLRGLLCLRALAITACNANGMHDAEVNEFLVEVGLQEIQEVPCDWIDNETKEDSQHNAAVIRELRGDKDRLRADNNELRDDNSKMRSDTSQLCSQARVAFDKLDKKGRRIGHLEEENKTLRARIAALEAEKGEMNKARAHMQQQCLELRRQLELCPSISPTPTVDNIGDGDTPIHGPCESEDTKTKLQQRDAEVAELRDELNRERELLSRATVRHEDVVESLRADIARREDEMSSRIVLCARLENERDQLQRNVECLRARLDALQDADDGKETALDRAARNLTKDKKCAAAKMTEAERLALLQEQMEWNLPDSIPGKSEIRCKNQQALALVLVVFVGLYGTYTMKNIEMEETDQKRMAKKIEEIATNLGSSGCPFLLFADAAQLATQAKQFIRGGSTLRYKIDNIRSCKNNVWDETEPKKTIEEKQKKRNLHRRQHEFFIRIGLYD